MADSTRKDILDAIEAAVSGISSVKTVTQNYAAWWDFPSHKFPVVIIQDMNTEINRHAFVDSTADDMEAIMEVSCTCFVHDMNNSLYSKRTELISLIESTLVSDSTLAALILNIEPERIDTDNGSLDNYSIADVTFRVHYLYNHASP